jgi:hypothetical protein
MRYIQDCAGCQNAFSLHIGGQIQFYEKNYLTDSPTEIVYAKDLTIIDINTRPRKEVCRKEHHRRRIRWDRKFCLFLAATYGKTSPLSGRVNIVTIMENKSDKLEYNQ